MMRDWNTIRRILLALEAHGSTRQHLEDDHIEGADPEAVSYHLRLLIEADLVHGQCSRTIGGPLRCTATDLTWAGHELLDKIRSRPLWNRICELARQKGVELSLDVVKAASKAALEAMF